MISLIVDKITSFLHVPQLKDAGLIIINEKVWVVELRLCFLTVPYIIQSTIMHNCLVLFCFFEENISVTISVSLVKCLCITLKQLS